MILVIKLEKLLSTSLCPSIKIIMLLILGIFACHSRGYVDQPDEQIFSQQMDTALTYLESVCGKDGIKKMVILKDGETIYRGPESETSHAVWSCTKSFTSTVLGLLIAQDKCSLDQKVWEFLPELKEHYPEMTFRHFATMTSGYRAIGDEPKGDYVHGPSTTPFLPSPDRLFAPGEKYRYWDSAMNMFAYALTKVAGEPIKNLFQREIADPIGMDPEKWDWKDFGAINGIVVNGGAGNNNKGVSISATELARFGQLMLQEGKWDGKVLLKKQWVKEATSQQLSKIVPNEEFPYGFNWWTAGTFPDAPKNTFAAKGFNNNKCIVIPEWNLVIARLGLDGNIDDEKWNNFIKILGEAYGGKPN